MSPASQSSSLAQPTLPSPHLKSGVHLLQQHLSVLVSPWRGGIAFTHHLLRVVRVLLYRIPGPLHTVGPALVESSGSTIHTVRVCLAGSLGARWLHICTCPCVQGFSGLQRLVKVRHHLHPRAPGAAVVRGVPEPSGAAAVVLATDQRALAVRVSIAVPVPKATWRGPRPASELNNHNYVARKNSRTALMRNL